MNAMAIAMQIIVNGDAREVPPGITVSNLLAMLNVQTRAVAVERNLAIVPASQHGECVLADGDRLEIVTLVGGG